MRLLVASSSLLCAAVAAAQVPYNAAPDWISANPAYSTGAAFVDLDRDGHLDIVIADGNDIVRGYVNVYYNDGSGGFSTVADWRSAGVAYHGHLDVADVNGDGWDDVAIAILLSEGHCAALYLNNNGTLSSTPDWTSEEDVPAFGAAFGDVNGDGRPDLAVATGFAYDTPNQHHNYVYMNVDGALETTASWQSADTHDMQGVLFTDADNDGWLDLAGITARSQTRVYRNLGGALATTPAWQTTDSANQDGIMLAAGDVTGDGWRELFATDNTQLGGSGRFKQYDGLAGGFYETTYSWSYYDRYGSAVALADVNADGLLDLATGAWWDYTRIFLNDGAGLATSPAWNSDGTSVVEKIVFADVDPACGGELKHTLLLPGDGADTLFYLEHQPIQRILELRVDGLAVEPGEYTYSREYGWIALGQAPQQSVWVRYATSQSLDMLVSNWDSDKGNYLRYNQLMRDCNGNGVDDGCDIADGVANDFNDNGVPDSCETPISDIDGDGDVDQADLGALLGSYAACVGDTSFLLDADINADGCVDQSDLGTLLGEYGTN
jgi:hypothetical protein